MCSYIAYVFGRVGYVFIKDEHVIGETTALWCNCGNRDDRWMLVGASVATVVASI